MRTSLATLLVLSLALPAVFADPGSWYEETGVLTTSAGFVRDHDMAWVWLEAGDVLTATFTWDEAQGSASTWLRPGDGGCSATDLPCIMEDVNDPSLVLCPADTLYGGGPTAGSPQTISLTATSAGWHEVYIIGVVVPVALPYHMHISVNGQAPARIVPNTTLIGAGSGNHIWCPLL